MTPVSGSYVTLLCYNNFTQDGYVKSWSKDTVILENKEKNLVTVFNTKDIFKYDIFIDIKTPIVQEKPALKDHNSRLIELSELHKLKIQEEKKAIQKSLTEFKPTGSKQINYESPFFRKPT